MPLPARLSAYSRSAATAGAERGATAAWSRNAHRVGDRELRAEGGSSPWAHRTRGTRRLWLTGGAAYNPNLESWYSRSLTVFAEPARTPYDLNFRLFGFAVRIHPLFWLGAALLGASTLNAGLALPADLDRSLFSSRSSSTNSATPSRFAGSVRDSHIVLWMFGGLAVPYSASDRPLAPHSRFPGRADRGVRPVRCCLRFTHELD